MARLPLKIEKRASRVESLMLHVVMRMRLFVRSAAAFWRECQLGSIRTFNKTSHRIPHQTMLES